MTRLRVQGCQREGKVAFLGQRSIGSRRVTEATVLEEKIVKKLNIPIISIEIKENPVE